MQPRKAHDVPKAQKKRPPRRATKRRAPKQLELKFRRPATRRRPATPPPPSSSAPTPLWGGAYTHGYDDDE
jgi:hypothetical protein